MDKAAQAEETKDQKRKNWLKNRNEDFAHHWDEIKDYKINDFSNKDTIKKYN